MLVNSFGSVCGCPCLFYVTLSLTSLVTAMYVNGCVLTRDTCENVSVGKCIDREVEDVSV